MILLFSVQVYVCLDLLKIIQYLGECILFSQHFLRKNCGCLAIDMQVDTKETMHKSECISNHKKYECITMINVNSQLSICCTIHLSPMLFPLGPRHGTLSTLMSISDNYWFSRCSKFWSVTQMWAVGCVCQDCFLLQSLLEAIGWQPKRLPI